MTRTCRDCGSELLWSEWLSRRLPHGSGRHAHRAHGRCVICDARHRRAIVRQGRETTTGPWRSEDLVENARIVKQRDPGLSWVQVADTLGVLPRTLEQARTRVHRRLRTIRTDDPAARSV